ncbi:MAG: lysozyme inhibitor LprI family protein [Terracidiphilus sp.]|jgi:uncharacterized protein YecT (DUF1311 family)
MRYLSRKEEAMVMQKCGLMLIVLTGCVAHAASFDCKQAATPVEKAVCASPELNAADEKLAAAYKTALAAAPAEMKEAVREDQRNWLRGIAAHFTDCLSADYESVCTDDPPLYLLVYYKTRIEALQKLIQTKGGVTFVWRSKTHILAKKTNNFTLLDASWPQSMSATEEWKAWNAAIEAAARDTDWAHDEETMTGATVDIVGNDLVTATVYENSESMDFRYVWKQFNWLLKERRALRPSDLFRPGSGWNQFIEGRCDKDLHRQLDDKDYNYTSFLPGQMPHELHIVVMDPEDWKMDSKGLEVQFIPYTVAPPAIHPDPVLIPWADLKPYLQPGFVAPK